MKMLLLAALLASVSHAQRPHAGGSNIAGSPVTKFDCSPRVETWANKLNAIAEKSSGSQRAGRYTLPGGLVDASRFMTDLTRIYVSNRPNKVSPGGDELIVGENMLKVRLKGRLWNLVESPWYKDQYPVTPEKPDGLPLNKRRLVLRSEPNPMAMDDRPEVFEFALTEGFPNGKIDFAMLNQYADQAKANAAREKADPAGMDAYDLPKGPEIGYIGLVPSGSDVVVDSVKEDVQNLPGFLNCQGYNFVGFGSHSIVEVGGSPKDIVRAHIREFLNNNVKTIYLNAAAHGNGQGIHFPLPNGTSVILKPTDFTGEPAQPGKPATLGIFDEFSDTKFIVDTLACQAGGLAKAIENYKDPSGKRGRIVTFLQTKGSSMNQEGRQRLTEAEISALGSVAAAAATPKPVSSYYNIFRVQALMKKMNLGKAHLWADRLAKDLIPSDAEAYISTGTGGVGTKSITGGAGGTALDSVPPR